MEKSIKKVRTFCLGDEELYQLGCQTVELMTTDSTEFASFGIDQTAKVSLQDLAEHFRSRPYDEISMLTQKLATQTKDEKADNLQLDLVKLETKIRTVFGRKNPFYEMFDISSVSTLTPDEIVKKVEVIQLVVNGTFSSVFTNIISSTEMEKMVLKASELRTAILNQEFASRERVLNTFTRTEMANELYREVAKIRYIGKQMWAYSNYAKSRMYFMPQFKTKTSQASEDNVLIEDIVDNQDDTTS